MAEEEGKDGVSPIGELADSLALSLLGDLKKAKKVSDEEFAEFKEYFAALHQQVAEKYENERALLKLVRRRQNDVLGEKIKLERAVEKLESAERDLENLEDEKEQQQKKLDDAEQRDTITKYELAELERTHSDLVLTRDELKAENEALVAPEMKKIEAELARLKKESKRQAEAHERDTATKQGLLEKHTQLEEEMEEAEAELQEAKARLSKAQIEPERVKKQSESVQKAVNNLNAEIDKYRAKIAEADDKLAAQEAKRTEAMEVKTALVRKLELHESTIENRQMDVEALQRNLDSEKAVEHELATTRVELELERKGAEERLRHELESLSMMRKELDQLRRRLRKKQMMADSVKEVIPTLEAQLVDAEHSLRIFQEENRKSEASIEEAKQDVDVHIARFMKQEDLEKSKRDALEKLMDSVSAQEAETQQWQAEERRQNKLVALLTAQRELKAREAGKAQRLDKETRQLSKVKELTILDLTKKCNEVNNRLKEFSALYDVVKNERNKYVNLIQSSTQALAEMKEKIKILGNEVEILRNESLAKDKALSKETSSHTLSKTQRDGLRLELNKCQQEYRNKQGVVQQQIEDVKTKNSIINGLERDMLRLKRQYEDAVERRNTTGVSLIDRNDELCILYEKSNLQEATLKRGEVSIRQREEDIRTLKLEMAELERQLVVARNKLPDMPDLAEKAEKLRAELQDQKSQTEILCKELEDPGNEERYRALEGEDPGLEQLSAKVAVLEARLEEKKEQLLEKELVLEEVTTLTQKLRNRASDGRDSTFKLAQRVNEFQSRIRDVTRRMMATVSELSMYQATAMKLQQEKNEKNGELEKMRWRISHGEPPTEDAEREWYRLEEQKLARREARLAKQQAVGTEGGMVPAVTVRTTAEPRPNAYIPDDLGIPKPYGGLAPFKPTDPGASMRHIRVPNPPEIQI